MIYHGTRTRSLLVSETTGALSGDTVRMLLALAKQAKAPTTHDSTCYGTARTSPRSYFPHHTAAISAAIAFADATSVMHAVAALTELPALLGSRLSRRKPPAALARQPPSRPRV